MADQASSPKRISDQGRLQLAGTSGIYEIVNLVNGKRYVGSALDIPKRWREHRRDLGRGKHHNVALQRAWNKYGAPYFEVRVIELCDADDLIKLEQAAFDRLCPDYNICKIAGSTLGIRWSDETRAKLSQRLIGNQHTKGIKYSREICERMAAPKRGRKRGPMSDEAKSKLSVAKKGNSSCLGRVLSEATKVKLRQANLGKCHTVERRKKRCSLSDTQIRQIRAMRVSGATFAAIAAVYGIRHQLVGRICRRERYEWVDPHEPIPAFPRKGRRISKHSPESLLRHSTASKAMWAARRSVAVVSRG